MDTNITEPEHGNMSQDTKVTEPADTSRNTAEQVKPKVSKEDFFPKETNKPNQEYDALKEREARAETIAESIYNKHVTVDEDWELDFSKVPKDMLWAKERIQKRFQNPLVETQSQHARTTELKSIVEAELKQREFAQEVDRMVSDDSLSEEERDEIKREYTELAKTSYDVRMLKKAINIVELRRWSKKVVWSMPNLWKPSIDWSKKTTITVEQLSKLPQNEYNRISDLIEQKKMSITW